MASSTESGSVSIPGWALKLGGIILGLIVTITPAWLSMKSALDKQEVRLVAVEQRVNDNSAQTAKIGVIQNDIAYIKEGQKRIETLLGRLE